MKVRVKFSKNGPVKFLGHLDTMRYFQKAVRRAGIPVAFSEGFRPHMVISFAAPLSVGVTSDGEYFDMELSRKMASGEIVELLGGVMAEGFRVISAREVPDGRKYNAMSMTAAADYWVIPAGPSGMKALAGQAKGFCAQPSIWVEKETKGGRKAVDIRPGIYRIAPDGESCFMRLAASSANYVKPGMVMEAFAAYLGKEPSWLCYAVHREEIYANEGTQAAPRFVPLDGLSCMGKGDGGCGHVCLGEDIG